VGLLLEKTSVSRKIQKKQEGPRLKHSINNKGGDPGGRPWDPMFGT